MFWSQKAYTAVLKLLNYRVIFLPRRYKSCAFVIIAKSAGFIIMAAGIAYAVDLELPADERGLSALLEEQTLDTLQYEQLLVYYALPLSVPQGELSLLAELFPFLKEIIPDKEELEAYHPFDNRQIQKFFNEHPYLAGFQPILRFNIASSASRSVNGEIVFGINKSKIGELEGQRVRFRQKSARLSTDGSIVLSDSGVMFRRRRAAVYVNWADIELGNFKQPFEGELFFGNFSPLTNENESVKANWLYGAVRDWNGVSAKTQKFAGGLLGTSAFYHIRPAERGAGAGIDIYAMRNLKVQAAFTAFKRDSVDLQNGDSSIYSSYTAHLYAEYKTKIWRAVFETGFPLEHAGLAFPVSFRLNYRQNGSAAQYHLLMYPPDFNVPMSRIKKQILSEIGEKKYLHQVHKHNLKMTVPFLSGITLIPEIDFTESNAAVRRIYGRTQLKASSKRAEFSVKHSSKIFTSESDSVLHASAASIYMNTPHPIALKAAAEHYWGSYKYERTFYSLELHSSMLPNTLITPFIRGKHTRSEHEFWLGLKHELHLYKRNWSSITIEMPYGVKGDKSVYIRGSSSFTF